MAKEEAKKKEVNPEAEAKNWEDRVRTELEAPHKWAESWGTLFDNGVPHQYDKKIEHLQSQLKSMPNAQSLPKYGVGKPFNEITLGDHRRKKWADESKFE
jgi:hypothetical protein